MSITNTYALTLKVVRSKWGMFERIALLKQKSSIDQELLDTINAALHDTLIPALPIRTTVAIGDDAEQCIMSHLLKISENNSDFSVVDTSSQTNHGDMMVSYKNKNVCIEVKCYSKPVPIKEVEKYHKSLSHVEYDCGIMIQTNACGFTRECDIKTPIDFKINDGKPSIYLTGVDMALLYPVISLLISHDKTKEDLTVEIELEQKKATLLSIHEKVLSVRGFVDQQKRLIERMETNIDDIIKMVL